MNFCSLIPLVLFNIVRTQGFSHARGWIPLVPSFFYFFLLLCHHEFHIHGFETSVSTNIQWIQEFFFFFFLRNLHVLLRMNCITFGDLAPSSGQNFNPVLLVYDKMSVRLSCTLSLSQTRLSPLPFCQMVNYCENITYLGGLTIPVNIQNFTIKWTYKFLEHRRVYLNFKLLMFCFEHFVLHRTYICMELASV